MQFDGKEKRDPLPYEYPDAGEIAVKAVTDFLESHGDAMDRVVFNVFKDSDREIYERIFASGL